MEAYLLKSTICIGVILLIYCLALEREKMHKFKRMYLLFGLVLSLVITFLPNGQIVQPIDASNASLLTELTTVADIAETNSIQMIEVKEAFSWSLFVGMIYGVGFLFLMVRFIRNSVHLWLKARRNKKIDYRGARLVLLQEEVLPHTFFSNIYVNETQYRNGEIEEKLLVHELAHVQQRHSWDVFFVEIVKTVFWFNPILIYYKRMIQLNHEFLADESVNQIYDEVVNYQHLLLSTCQSNSQVYLASNINFQLTKKRIQMMTKKSSQRRIYFLMLSVIPVIVALILLLGQPVVAQTKVKEGSWKEIASFTDNSISNSTISSKKTVTDTIDKDELVQYKFMRGIGVKIPRSFSPNNDGKKEVLKPYGQIEGVKQFEWIIFNKYGDIVFQSNNINSSWNGKVGDSNDRPIGGVYVYSLKYKDKDDLDWNKNGEINLIMDPQQEIPVLKDGQLKKVKISELDSLPDLNSKSRVKISKEDYYGNSIIHYINNDGKTMIKSYNALPSTVREKLPEPQELMRNGRGNVKIKALEKGTVVYLKPNGSIVVGSKEKRSKDSMIPNPPTPPNTQAAPPSPPKSPNEEGVIPPQPPAPPSPLDLIDTNDPDITYWKNGKQISKSALDDIDPKEIESLNVHKEKDGSHSVTLITKIKDNYTSFSFTPSTDSDLDEVIEDQIQNSHAEYMLDGKKVEKRKIDELDPNDIKSINVIKLENGKKRIQVESKIKGRASLFLNNDEKVYQMIENGALVYLNGDLVSQKELTKNGLVKNAITYQLTKETNGNSKVEIWDNYVDLYLDNISSIISNWF